jgi:hypothetical protein
VLRLSPLSFLIPRQLGRALTSLAVVGREIENAIMDDPHDNILDDLDEFMDTLERKSLTEACELLEGNPQIILERLKLQTDEDGPEQVLIEMVYDDCEFHVSERVQNASARKSKRVAMQAWRRSCRAVRNSNILSLDTLSFWQEFSEFELNGELFARAAQCIDTIFAEVKQNTTIETAYLNLTGVSMNDLIYFIQNNTALTDLWLSSEEPVSLEQSTALSRAIGSVHLEVINIKFCCFENNGSFGQMLGGCLRVDSLEVWCRDD